MTKKIAGWKTKGMNRDLSVSAFNPEFAFENRNLRLSTNEGNTTLSWVNERGTEKMDLNLVNIPWYPEDLDDDHEIKGIPIGTAVINLQLVLFTTNQEENFPDRIYVLKYLDDDKTSLSGKIIYHGNLDFRTDAPLETLVSYEAEHIQKVYWTDGVNQPRVINIAQYPAAEALRNIQKWNPNNRVVGIVDSFFDFVPELSLQEDVKVLKILGSSGMFAPGVIQYAFTYYNRYCQETNIFYTTPLLYISHKDRGASPEDKVDNAFRITISNIDTKYDFLRIYSIQRTSLNATPICKRVHDIDLTGIDFTGSEEPTVSYVDTGFSGDSIDPTELLYKGGDSISAKTMEQKDGTLFLGNIRQTITPITGDLKSSIEAIKVSDTELRTFTAELQSVDDDSANTSYGYGNQLNAVQLNTVADKSDDESVPCGGFKAGDYYRFGLQFQYKTGKWSEPVFINKRRDKLIGNYPTQSIDDDRGMLQIGVPQMVATIDPSIMDGLYEMGYRKVRPVVVFPEMQDRVTICQGVVCPTMYTDARRSNDRKDLYAQASWFFRPYAPSSNDGYGTQTDGTYLPGYGKDASSKTLFYKLRGTNDSPGDIKKVEIQGHFDPDNQFKVDYDFLTFNSPEIDFNDQILNTSFKGTQYRKVWDALVQKVLSDIDIQTETPTISNIGTGFVHKSFAKAGNYGIGAGLFYEDFLVDDMGDNEPFSAWVKQRSPVKFMVYPWNRSGSLNNDINRPANHGIRSAVLKRKIISNLRYTINNLRIEKPSLQDFTQTPELFSSEGIMVIKVGSNIYQGNVDTLLNPDETDGTYFALGTTSEGTESEVDDGDYNVETPFNYSVKWKTFNESENSAYHQGVWKWESNEEEWSQNGHNPSEDIGREYLDIVVSKEPVRMKYMSTPHLVFKADGSKIFDELKENGRQFPVIEIINTNNTYQNSDTRFGGTKDDALKANRWIPCGKPVPLELLADSPISVYFSYGDTYYQRWDCLKTYPFTKEDPNQIVEIGSFVLETRVNIDGRYDRNRGQSSNIHMSPQNFNLINPVYSQVDNFFTYMIMGDDTYTSNKYPNQLTWSKTKSSGAEVDMWTNVTLASVLELDGDKGEINKLVRFSNQLLALQDTGLAHILYNENVQVSTENGVPVEIANSGKVQGKRYIAESIGCSNKWSVVTTPMGIYFIDSSNKGIYMYNGKLSNVSGSLGFNSWAMDNIPAIHTVGWNPVDFSDFVAYYDKMNLDVLFISADECLAYSEKLGVFTSFYDYYKIPYFVNLEDTSIWIGKSRDTELKEDDYKLWKHQLGKYCNFFDMNSPYSTILVGNFEPQLDKIFTNLEFRACVEGDGELNLETGKFTPYTPFDSLETWNEYLHGIANIGIRTGHAAMVHHSGIDASLKRKFRIWRCDIPRNNYELLTYPERELGESDEHYQQRVDAYNDWLKGETEKGIYRHSRKPLDRMRNPWLYLKLGKYSLENMPKSEVHGIEMSYFI